MKNLIKIILIVTVGFLLTTPALAANATKQGLSQGPKTQRGLKPTLSKSNPFFRAEM